MQFGICGSYNVEKSIGLMFIASMPGFDDPRCAVISLLQLLPGSLVILAPVCSSFSFMSSSQNCRYLFMPEGNEGLGWVKAGNVMSVRVTLLCHLCAALGLVFIVEQPASGKFGLMPRWEYFCENVCYVRGLQLVYIVVFTNLSVYRGNIVVFSCCCYVCHCFWLLLISKPVNTHGFHNLEYLEIWAGLILYLVMVLLP